MGGGSKKREMRETVLKKFKISENHRRNAEKNRTMRKTEMGKRASRKSKKTKSEKR